MLSPFYILEPSKHMTSHVDQKNVGYASKQVDYINNKNATCNDIQNFTKVRSFDLANT